MTVLISADRIVTGRAGEVIERGAVLVSDRQITWVGALGALPERALREADHRHLEGATLMPGLIEGHAHLCLDGGKDPFGRLHGAGPEEVLTYARDAAETMARKGITTVRDMGSVYPVTTVVRTEIASGRLRGPRVLTAGVPLTTPGGHCAAFGGVVDGEEDMVEHIQANRRDGATWTKLMVTGGFLTSKVSSPYVGQFEASLLDAAVALSHELGLKVAAHAHGTAGIRMAVAAGVDTIEHCTWMTESGFDFAIETAAEIARQGIGVGLTINSRARDAKGRLPWRARCEQLIAMRAAGVSFIACTDCGIGGTPHDDLPASLISYTDAGYTPIEVIEMATSGNARMLGIGDITGSLAAGSMADLLAVDGDPLVDLAHLSRTRLVMVEGAVIPSGRP
ncbi:amidohydrolase family protein [Streptomyces sp. NPDC002659]|uniref:amidohydrolase family protein n=1 Tax=Streptomyces sp. NPDC002659 TaxID=3364656 RepID=UPI0036C4C80A